MGTEYMQNLALKDSVNSAFKPSPVWKIIKESLATKGNRYLMLFYDSEVTKHLLLMNLKE
jgi:hypothetical protein